MGRQKRDGEKISGGWDGAGNISLRDDEKSVSNYENLIQTEAKDDELFKALDIVKIFKIKMKENRITVTQTTPETVIFME